MIKRGRGGYVPDDYNLETSFLDLLDLEKEKVESLNTHIRAYDKAKKHGMMVHEYVHDIEEAQKEVDEVRAEIREFCENKIGIKTNIAETLNN